MKLQADLYSKDIINVIGNDNDGYDINTYQKNEMSWNKITLTPAEFRGFLKYLNQIFEYIDNENK